MASGVNFAGHFVIATWGCGAGCAMSSIVDAKTGQVYFPDEIRDNSSMHANTVDNEKFPLIYQKDSNLLIVLGSPDEGNDHKKDGISYYRWTGKKLELVRFIKNEKQDCDDGE